MITPKARSSRCTNWHARHCVPVLVRGAIDTESGLPYWQSVELGRIFNPRGLSLSTHLVLVERDDYSWAAIEPRTGLAVVQDCDTLVRARRMSEQRIMQHGGAESFESKVEYWSKHITLDEQAVSMVKSR
jgi:hypothetical protein